MSAFAVRGVSVRSVTGLRLVPGTACGWRLFHHHRQTCNVLTSRAMHTNVIESTKHLSSFYRRPLPTPPCTAFSSSHGRVLFSEALAQGTAEAFFPLVEQFRTQDHPAYCGLASLAMVLNALQIDPGRTWKGAWRWFDESKLDCCKPLDRCGSSYLARISHRHRVMTEGVTFSQVVCLARCNGARVVAANLADRTTEDEFRRHVVETCSSTNDYVLVSYSRKGVSQTGDGHFSPVSSLESFSRCFFMHLLDWSLPQKCRLGLSA